MKAALIALALLATPAAADTIRIGDMVYMDLSPASFSVQYPEFYQELLEYGYYGNFPGCIYCDYPHPILWDTVFSQFQSTFPGLSFQNFIVGPPPAVPEPSTWALLLFGFAFFAIKGIWPARKSHE